MRSLFRYVFAAFLATTVYYYSNGSENMVLSNDPEAEYMFVEEHDLKGETRTRQEIEEDSLCPPGSQICAVNVENSLDVIEWNGGSTKF